MVIQALIPGESREKKRAALLSVGSAMLLVSLKAFLVIRTGSLGVLSEALHSGLDLIAAIITFLSIRVSDQPADERHPYGHGKFENFSAFVETGLLVVPPSDSALPPVDQLPPSEASGEPNPATHNGRASNAAWRA